MDFPWFSIMNHPSWRLSLSQATMRIAPIVWSLNHLPFTALWPRTTSWRQTLSQSSTAFDWGPRWMAYLPAVFRWSRWLSCATCAVPLVRSLPHPCVPVVHPCWMLTSVCDPKQMRDTRKIDVYFSGDQAWETKGNLKVLNSIKSTLKSFSFAGLMGDERICADLRGVISDSIGPRSSFFQSLIFSFVLHFFIFLAGFLSVHPVFLPLFFCRFFLLFVCSSLSSPLSTCPLFFRSVCLLSLAF